MALSKATTVDDMMKSFPTHSIVPVEGRPTYRTLKPIFKSVDKCAESIPSNQPKGHLYLTTTNTEFHRVTGDWKVIPTKPTPTPTVPPAATKFVIAQANCDHNTTLKVYHAHQIASEALKKLITDNIQEIYLDGIDAGSSSPIELIQYLKDHYYKISSLELAKNDKALRSDWDVETPIEQYFRTIKMCQELADDAQEPYTDKQIIQIMFIQMQRIEFFRQTNREWKRKTSAQKTIENFKTDYIEAYEEYLDDLENVSEDDNEENNAHNAITDKMINDYLKEKDSDEQSENENEQFAHMAQTNQQLCDLLTKLLPGINREAPPQRSNGGGRGYGAGRGYGGGRGHAGRGGGRSNPNAAAGKMAWRHIPPKDGEPTTKVFEGVTYKWCGTCKRGEGLWTRGVGMHDTADHDPTKSSRK